MLGGSHLCTGTDGKRQSRDWQRHQVCLTPDFLTQQGAGVGGEGCRVLCCPAGAPVPGGPRWEKVPFWAIPPPQSLHC